MIDDQIKLAKAKNVILKIAEGINPVDGTLIEDDSFLKDPRIKRCMLFVAEVLGKAVRNYKNDGRNFYITEEQIKMIVLPEGNIGGVQFAKIVNTYLDHTKSKKLTVKDLYSQLKKLGALSEEVSEKGKSRTVLNENSLKYGIIMEPVTFEGHSYNKIVFNETGKNYLMENLEYIMGY